MDNVVEVLNSGSGVVVFLGIDPKSSGVGSVDNASRSKFETQ